MRALPNVEIHFAIKSLPHEGIISTLRDEGAYFDLATSGEIDLIKNCNI
jgi:ornithine decarboxylase